MEAKSLRPVNEVDVGCDQHFVTDTFEQACVERDYRLGPSILVVDDDPMTRAMVSHLLTGHDRYEAMDGVAALATYSRIAPDIVFLDIGLPGVNGLDVLRSITSHDPQAFVVMLTGNASEGTVKGAIAAGAKGYISKPFTISKVKDYLVNWKGQLKNANRKRKVSL